MCRNTEDFVSGKLSDKVAFVTGGSSGIGRSTALAFAQKGARVAVVDVDVEGGEETSNLIEKQNGEAIFIRADVSSAKDVERAVSDTIDAWGRLDCGFNNAGANTAHLEAISPIQDYPEANWDRVINVNLKGVWLCLKYEIPHMIAQGGGSIVNTSSALGLVGCEDMSAYVASKHGIVGLTRTAALENARHSIRVNAVCPGYIKTKMTAARLEDPESTEKLLSREPMGRIGEPEEVASAVVWLCSDDASFVTGHAMAIDGGWTSQ